MEAVLYFTPPDFAGAGDSVFRFLTRVYLRFYSF